MEEIIRHIHMEMLQAHCDDQSYIDDYMFLTEHLENVFQENRNVKLEVFLMLYCEEGEVNLELNNVARHLPERNPATHCFSFLWRDGGRNYTQIY
jgi:AraC family transcriptional activator of pobA